MISVVAGCGFEAANELNTLATRIPFNHVCMCLILWQRIWQSMVRTRRGEKTMLYMFYCPTLIWHPDPIFAPNETSSLCVVLHSFRRAYWRGMFRQLFQTIVNSHRGSIVARKRKGGGWKARQSQVCPPYTTTTRKHQSWCHVVAKTSGSIAV